MGRTTLATLVLGSSALLASAACGGSGGDSGAAGSPGLGSDGGDAGASVGVDAGSEESAPGDASPSSSDGSDGGADAATSPGFPWEDTYDAIHYFQTFDSSVSNVATLASHAVFVWGADQPVASYRSSSNPKITLSDYMPWAYDSDATHDLAYWKAQHPDWILYQCDKTTPAYYGGTTNMPLDVSNPAVIDWQVQTAGAKAAAAGYDMIAADEFQLGGWGGCGVYRNGQWTQLYSAGTGDPQADKDAVAWLSSFHAKLHALSHPLGLIPNFQLGGQSPTDPNVLAVVAATDGILDECSYTQCGSGHATGQAWRDLVTFSEYVQQQGKGYMAIDEVASVTNDEVQWALASYLMSKEHASGIFVSGVQQYGTDLWRSEYAAAIGAPCGAMQPTQGAYARTFKTGLAIANPGNGSVTFTLPSGTFTDLYGAKQGATVTLAAGAGIVLVASASQC